MKIPEISDPGSHGPGIVGWFTYWWWSSMLNYQSVSWRCIIWGINHQSWPFMYGGILIDQWMEKGAQLLFKHSRSCKILNPIAGFLAWFHYPGRLEWCDEGMRRQIQNSMFVARLCCQIWWSKTLCCFNQPINLDFRSTQCRKPSPSHLVGFKSSRW